MDGLSDMILLAGGVLILEVLVRLLVCCKLALLQLPSSDSSQRSPTCSEPLAWNC